MISTCDGRSLISWFLHILWFCCELEISGELSMIKTRLNIDKEINFVSIESRKQFIWRISYYFDSIFLMPQCEKDATIFWLAWIIKFESSKCFANWFMIGVSKRRQKLKITTKYGQFRSRNLICFISRCSITQKPNQHKLIISFEGWFHNQILTGKMCRWKHMFWSQVESKFPFQSLPGLILTIASWLDSPKCFSYLLNVVLIRDEWHVQQN